MLFVKKFLGEYSLDADCPVRVSVVLLPLVLAHGVALVTDWSGVITRPGYWPLIGRPDLGVTFVIVGGLVVVTGLLGTKHQLPEIVETRDHMLGSLAGLT